MIWEVPLTAFIVVCGFLGAKALGLRVKDDGKLVAVEKDLEDVKRKVDSLILRAGFKL